MAGNRYPAECQRLIDEYRPVVALWLEASGYDVDDVRQAIARAWLAGEDPRVAVPKELGIRKLRGVGGWRSAGQKHEDKVRWVSKDPTVWRAELNDDAAPSDARLLPLRDARGSVTRGIAADQGIGLRAAQKRLKKARDRARQGDLFGGES